MRYPCPCCGHLTLGEPAGSYDICPVCFWEDDPVQLEYPDAPVGANGGVSLIDAQRNFARFGVMDEQFKQNVRPPAKDEPIDETWRPFDPERDAVRGSSEPSSGLDYFYASKEIGTDEELGPDALYYWRAGARGRPTWAQRPRQLADRREFADAAAIIGASVLLGKAAGYVLARLVRWFGTH